MQFEDINICAWCNKRVPENDEVYGLGAGLRPDIDFTDRAGEIIPVYLASTDREVPAIVTTSDSEAKRDGYDVIFLICCEKCGEALKAVLQTEIDFFENIEFA